MYLSIFNSFPVIRTASEKIAVVTYCSPHFCFPWRRPCDYHAISCMDGKTIQCLPKLSQHVPIFNSFRVQCVSPKIPIFTTFWFPLRTPLGQSRKTLHKWKDNSVLAKPLAACTHLSSTFSQLFEPQVQEIAVFMYRSPHFCFPWRRRCDYQQICSMDGKTIQCLPKPSQHVPIYLQ